MNVVCEEVVFLLDNSTREVVLLRYVSSTECLLTPMKTEAVVLTTDPEVLI